MSLHFISHRGTSSPGPPYTLARGGPMPRSARVARSPCSLAQTANALQSSSLSHQLAKEPRLRQTPISRHRHRRHAEYLGGLLDGQSAEEAQLHHPALARIHLRQCHQRIIECHERARGLVGRRQRLVEREVYRVAAALDLL